MARTAATTTTVRIKKELTLEELEKSTTGPVYVTNKSGSGTEINRGQILISVERPSGGKSDLVRIPKTFIPVDISLQVPRATLIQAAELRKAINSGLIQLNTREYAEHILSTDEGRAESTRVKNELLRSATAIKNAMLTEAKPEEDEYIEVSVKKGKADTTAAPVAEAPAKKKPVDIKLQSLVVRLKEEKATPINIVTALRNRGSFTKRELSWLAVQYKDVARVMKFLKAERSALEETAA